jgi:hypothetical protein
MISVAMACSTKRRRGDSPLRSSTKPVTTSSVIAAKKATYFAWRLPVISAISATTTNPPNIASPPTSGMSPWWRLRPPGASTTPSCGA